MFFDDLPKGYVFETGRRVLALDEILEFAQKWDPQTFHLDEDAAQKGPFGGLIASGFHTIMVAFVLTLEAEVWREASMGSPGMDNIRWAVPVRPGDELRARCTVLDSAPSKSRPDRGRVVIRTEILNQKDELVSEYTATHILRRA
ncbi:Acyl dehydratase [Shimia gijangensis]|uniref:Acyl dehydratase n=1 Tax=Shimia gijangensis TaxID=1470563 RepID=A0A1M6IMJ4_9RHOB|nr:MaoC family dehydratase [Shimia gijangensis]SHJ35654.1 Acyl dehydratase [Shimia gijangensis]